MHSEKYILLSNLWQGSGRVMLIFVVWKQCFSDFNISVARFSQREANLVSCMGLPVGRYVRVVFISRKLLNRFSRILSSDWRLALRWSHFNQINAHETYYCAGSSLIILRCVLFESFLFDILEIKIVHSGSVTDIAYWFQPAVRDM